MLNELLTKTTIGSFGFGVFFTNWFRFITKSYEIFLYNLFQTYFRFENSLTVTKAHFLPMNHVILS